ncbi:MAG: phasin family protein, partial [Rhodospirillales bacterium]
TDVNQAATESLKAIAQRQTEILQETMKETQTAIDALTKSKTPQDATTAQIDFVKSAFKAAFSNMSELANLMTSTNKDSMEKLNARLSANIHEIQVWQSGLRTNS